MALDKIIVEYELELKKFKQQTKTIDKQLEKTEKDVKQSSKTASKELDSFGKTAQKIGGFITAAFAVQKVIAFGSELVQLRKEAEGVQRAFSRIPESSKLLRDLKKETGGVTSELQLMTAAVKARNFKIPLEQLGSLLKFAQVRARQTGESVEYLVNSIIDGVSRKSLPILDNLGLSMGEIRGEMQKTGDLGSAVFAIVNRELEATGNQTDLLADQMDRNNANWENFKLTLSEGVGPSASRVNNIFGQLIGRLDEMAKQIIKTDNVAKGKGFLGDLIDNAQTLTKPELLEKIESFFDIIRITAQKGDAADDSFIAQMNQAVLILQANLERLSAEVDGDAVVSLALLNTQLKELKDQLLNAALGTKEETELLEKLTAKENELTRALVAQEVIRQRIFDRQKEETVRVEPKGPGTLDVSDPVEQEQKTQEQLATIKDEALVRDKERNQERRQENISFFLEESEFIVNAVEKSLSAFSDFANNIAQIKLDNLTRQLQQGAITQEQFDKRRAEIMREQAIREKAFNLFESITNTAVAITAALKEGPIQAALVGTLGAAQIAAIISQPIPQFAEGVVGLNGKGTETSDSIPAMLSRNESVITAKGTRQDKGLFEAANRLQLDKYINDHYVLPELAKATNMTEQQAAMLGMVGSGVSGVGGVDLIHALNSNANKRNKNEDRNSIYVAKEIGKQIAREGYYRSRYS